jgi:hypothetical protein
MSRPGLTKNAVGRANQFWRRMAERSRITRPTRKGKTMTSGQIPMSARELLAKGWEFTQQSMALAGLPVPDCIHFQINGRRQIRASPSSTNWRRQ